MLPMARRLARTEQVERNREVVLAAARRVFIDRGYSGATVDVIANEAGFSTGVVYSQFGSKADLFLALLERRIEERGADNERVAADLTGAEGVRELLRAAGRDAVAEQRWAGLLVEFRVVAARDPDLNDRYAALHRRTVDLLATLLARLLGPAADPTVPFPVMAEFILAVGTGATIERAANPAALADDHVLVMLPRALGIAEPDSPAPGEERPGSDRVDVTGESTRR
jgi:AcrR family transcriptional regulator